MCLIFSLIKCSCKYEWEMVDKYQKYYSLETDINKWLDYLSPSSALCSWASLVAVSKELTCNAGDPGLIPRSGRYTGEGIGYPLQYSWASLVAQWWRICLQNRDLGSIPGWEDPLEDGMATGSSILARRIPWLVTSAAAAATKSLQSCPTLWDPIQGSPPSSPVPGVLQARTVE